MRFFSSLKISKDLSKYKKVHVYGFLPTLWQFK